MRIAKGPRPWSIRIFGLALLTAALASLLESLATHPALLMARWFARAPFIAWSPDLAIIASFTTFTIALIPLVWIYFFASNRARWVVLAFGLIKLGSALHSMSSTVRMKAPELVMFEAVLVAVALAMLFMPATAHWLRGRRTDDAAAFE